MLFYHYEKCWYDDEFLLLAFTNKKHVMFVLAWFSFSKYDYAKVRNDYDLAEHFVDAEYDFNVTEKRSLIW